MSKVNETEVASNSSVLQAVCKNIGWFSNWSGVKMDAEMAIVRSSNPGSGIDI